MENSPRRRFPRASLSLPCAVGDASGRVLRGRLWSATCDGVGLDIAVDDVAEGDEVRLTFRADAEAIEIPARIVWRHPGGRATSAGAVVALDAAPADVPATYAAWLIEHLRRARAEALRLGACLALQRRISLRTLQEALDVQAVTGGPLDDALRSIGVTGVDTALAVDEALSQPPSPIRLPDALDEWAAALLAPRS